MGISKFTLDGKIALITGGSRGIGRAIALGFADAGANVAISGRKLPDLEKAAGEIAARGRRSLAVTGHAAKAEDLANLVNKVVEEFGKIDILVNGAATNPVYGQIIDMEERAWDAVMNLNLKGLFLLSQMVAKVMREHGGGNIINIASDAGIRPSKGLGAYSVSKASVIMLTKVMAQECAQYNIRVNAIAPGMVQTRFSAALWDNPERLNDYIQHTPLRRIAQPEEMVPAALYLASDASSYVTGETIVLEGGASI